MTRAHLTLARIHAHMERNPHLFFKWHRTANRISMRIEFPAVTR